MDLLDKLNADCPGWSISGNLMVNRDPIRGGIIDCGYVTGEWFVIFNNIAVSSETEWFPTADDAVRYFLESLV